VAPEREQAWREFLAEAAAADGATDSAATDSAGAEGLLPATPIGTVTASPELVIQQGDIVLIHLPVSQLREAYEQAIPRRMGQAGPPPDR